VAEEEGVEYIDHTKYAVNRWQAFGSLNATMPYYPLNDYTHTSWPGAESKSCDWNEEEIADTGIVNAETLVTSVKCGHHYWWKSQLAWYLNRNASKIDYPC
jgi:rhamnogalacturonan acetylesterase